jgi:hypothetical protein
MKEIFTLSQREVQRMQVLEQVVRGALSLKSATELMKVCYRQAKRLLARYRGDGPKGLSHRRRGRRPANAISPETRERVLTLHRDVYANFNDTQFVEMLADRERDRPSLAAGGQDPSQAPSPTAQTPQPTAAAASAGAPDAVGRQSPSLVRSPTAFREPPPCRR